MTNFNGVPTMSAELQAAAADVGADQLVELCGNLDRLAREERITELDLCFEQVLHEHQRVVHDLRNMTEKRA